MRAQILDQSCKNFTVPIELLCTEDWRATGATVEAITPEWLDHNKIYSGLPIARLWPHQRLFEYFRAGLDVKRSSYIEWHQDNFSLRGLEPPFNDWDLLVFRFDQFKKWSNLLEGGGIAAPEFTLSVRLDVKSNCWMLVDGHHRSAFLRTSGVRRVQVTAAQEDWETWHHSEGVETVRRVIGQQNRVEFYTPILHPDFQELMPLRDFAYKSRLDHILEFLGPRCRSGTLVDIGSNAGFFAHHFTREGFDVVGFDPDPNHHSLATALSTLYRLPTTFENTPFQGASGNRRFDGALLLTVLYHFLEKAEHLPLLEKLDALVEHFVIWESGSRPEEEKRQIRDHTKFAYYVKIANTYGTGRSRELGLFCTAHFLERTLRIDGTAYVPESVNQRDSTGPAHGTRRIDGPYAESISGPGSTLAYTLAFRKSLERFLNLSQCTTLFDGPCGDFNWMKQVTLPSSMQYVGGDISSELIKANREKFAGPTRLFVELDLIAEPHPAADIWLCRDFLFSLSYGQIVSSLRNGLMASHKYYLITSHTNEINSDNISGSFRELNLRAAPFHFSAPILTMTDCIAGFPERYVGVWSRDQLLAACASMD